MHFARLKLLLILLMTINFVHAQELKARVTVNSSRVGTTVNKNVFQTLQTALNTFLNNRKWTKDAYLANEKRAKTSVQKKVVPIQY